MPIAGDIATCMCHTGGDPLTGQEVFIAKGLRDRRMQRALMQFFKPENYFEVRKALEETGRTDLIGGGCDALIPAHPPREAIEARRRRATQETCGEYVHQIPNPESKKGYRPGRNSAKRRQGKKGRRDTYGEM